MSSSALDLPKKFGIHPFLSGIACFGFGALHVTGWLSNKSTELSEDSNLENFNIYEYEAPNGMRPDQLMECFQNKYEDRHPTTDSTFFSEEPYLPEDIGEWYLHRQFLTSKYRTTKENAEIFLVNTMPILSAYVDECNGMTHNDRQMKWVEIIKDSDVFQERPKDHLFICQSWTCWKILSHEIITLAYQMTYLIHEDNTKWMGNPLETIDNTTKWQGNPLLKPSNVIVIPYVAHSGIPTFNKPWNERKFKITFIGTIRRRTPMRRVLNRQSVRDLAFLNIVDEGVRFKENNTVDLFNAYIDNMVDSQFCLVIQGDSPSSRRLFDSMVTGCIPVFTGVKYTMPFENLIPYHQFSIRIDEKEWVGDTSSALQNINNISNEEGLRMYANMLKYKKYINYRHGQGVLESILRIHVGIRMTTDDLV